jgi:dCMP deaminase
MPKQTKHIVLYMPVLHSGYIKLFDHFPDIKSVLVFGDDLLVNEPYLTKDLRALHPKQQKQVLEGLGRFEQVQIISKKELKTLLTPVVTFITPDDDLSRSIDFGSAKVERFPIFLRWDRRTAEAQESVDDIAISKQFKHQKYMKQAYKEATKSSDLWRRVGAVFVSADGKTVIAQHNTGEPHEHSPMMEGDPRNIFNKGVNIETSVFSHAESLAVAEAARHGVAMAGGTLYVTTFPCPVCAKLVARSGIKSCYFSEGYAMLDGRRVLEGHGVKLGRIEAADDQEDPAVWVPYKR